MNDREKINQLLADLATVQQVTRNEVKGGDGDGDNNECLHCDPSVGHVCQLCFINAAAGEAKRLIEQWRKNGCYPDDYDGRTHWDGCWQARGHHECAIAEVRRMKARIEREIANIRAELVANRPAIQIGQLIRSMLEDGTLETLSDGDPALTKTDAFIKAYERLKAENERLKASLVSGICIIQNESRSPAWDGTNKGEILSRWAQELIDESGIDFSAELAKRPD